MIDVMPIAASRNTLERLAAFTARLLAVPIAILSLGDDDVRAGAGTAETGEWAMVATSPDMRRVTSQLSDPRLLALPSVARDVSACLPPQPWGGQAGWAL